MKPLILLLSVTTLCSAQHMDFAFDSGDPIGPYGTALGGGYYCDREDYSWTNCINSAATKLTFLDGISIESIEVYLQADSGVWNESQGPINLNLYTNRTGSIPGDLIYNTQIYAAAGREGWIGTDPINLVLEPGSYWVALELDRDSMFTGGWFRSAPLATELDAHLHRYRAYEGATDWSFSWEQSTVQNAHGLRIHGEVGELGLGDLNRNGRYDANDIDYLMKRILDWDADYTYDINGDYGVNFADWFAWVELTDAIPGDANFDYVFDTTDLIQLFQAGEYEDRKEENSYWSTGDFTGDSEFDSSDLLLAFQTGAFEQTVARVVPEPATIVYLFLFFCWLPFYRK